jgi:hypothetical protein
MVGWLGGWVPGCRNIFKTLRCRERERKREKERQHNSEVNRQRKIYFCRRMKEQAHAVGIHFGF